jgi:hypothetical protein
MEYMFKDAEVVQAKVNAHNDLGIANNETKGLKHQASVVAIAKAKAEALAAQAKLLISLSHHSELTSSIPT